jgi:hypothetical protein
MIKETFIALKAIGVSDQHILDVIAALESRHDEYRRDIHEIKRDVAVLKWATAALFGLLLPILWKVFS